MIFPEKDFSEMLPDFDKNRATVHTFEETPPISTYLYSMYVGNYSSFEDHTGPVPMRIFARQSKAKFVNYREMFSVIKAGIKYFEWFFECQFPFSKYD